MFRFASFSQLRRNLGSTSAVKRVTNGIWTCTRKPALAEDFSALASSAALKNHSLRSGNPCGAARSKLICTSAAKGSDLVTCAQLICTSATEGSDLVTCALTGDVVEEEVFSYGREKIKGSLVCLAVCRGGETLALLPGTIIRSDGIVATCASRLTSLIIKELKATVNVKVLDTEATYEGVLLDADFRSNVAFIKIMSPGLHEEASFAKPDYLRGGRWVMAMGCTGHGLPDARSLFSPSHIGSVAKGTENKQSDARTFGQAINAELDDEFEGSVIGGPLVHPFWGVIGVIHYEDGPQIKAMPIDEVLKCLERFEKHGEQHPKSVPHA